MPLDDADTDPEWEQEQQERAKEMEKERAREQAFRQEAEMEDEINRIGKKLWPQWMGIRPEGEEEEQEKKRQRITSQPLTGFEKMCILDQRISFARMELARKIHGEPLRCDGVNCCDGVNLGELCVVDSDEEVYDKIESVIVHVKRFYIGATYSPAVRWLGSKAKDMKGHCEKYKHMDVLGIRGDFEGGILEEKMINRFKADECYKHWCDNKALDHRGITTEKKGWVDWEKGEGIHFVYVCYNY